MAKLPEIILVNKPVGITSFDVIRRLRKQTGIKKFGHAGTLDPLASGLMILGVEEGTKKLSEYIKLDKEYEAEVILGESRTTADQEGDIVEECNVSSVDMIEVENVLHGLTGEQELPVSAYSAIKKDGVPMYKRARSAQMKGEVVEDVPIRKMMVHEAKLLDVKFSHQRQNKLILHIRFKVGSGTYIRSLAEEIGRRLGVPACLYSLRRTKIGEFALNDAKEIDEF